MPKNPIIIWTKLIKMRDNIIPTRLKIKTFISEIISMTKIMLKMVN